MAKKSKKILKVKRSPLAETDKIKRTRIRVIGIGGGGGNVVSEIASRIKGASFVAANTDHQALKILGRKTQVFQFGESFTHGLGTGMNPETAELAAEAEKEKIKKLLQGQDMVILVATLGGGTGSGAAPVFAKISRSLGILTLGILTLPFKFEGERKMEIANAALEKLKSRLNTFSVVPNERVFQIVEKTTPLVKAFSAINKILAKSLEGLIETIFEPGLINIDFADVGTILAGQGRLAYLNTVEIPKSESSAKETIEKVLNSPLYAYNIRGAKGVLLNIAGEKELELTEVSQISQTISNLANKEAKIIFGISQGKKYQNIVKTTLLATGCAQRNFSDNPVKPKSRRPKKNRVIKTIKEVAQKVILPRKPKPAVRKPPEALKKDKRPKAKPVSRVKEPVAPLIPEKPAAQPVVEKKIEIRKNAIQIKEEVEAEEAKMLEQEKAWETPAFLRKNRPFTAQS
ncbi:MAG: cell division protein FtsZ [bacterium]|nr:cell division protein FtsZ [bacterium]